MQHEGATRIVMRIGSERSFPSVLARWKRTQGTRDYPIAQEIMYAYWGFSFHEHVRRGCHPEIFAPDFNGQEGE